MWYEEVKNVVTIVAAWATIPNQVTRKHHSEMQGHERTGGTTWL